MGFCGGCHQGFPPNKSMGRLYTDTTATQARNKRVEIFQNTGKNIATPSPFILAMSPSYRNVVGQRTSNGPIGQVWGANVGLFIISTQKLEKYRVRVLAMCSAVVKSATLGRGNNIQCYTTEGRNMGIKGSKETTRKEIKFGWAQQIACRRGEGHWG